MAPTALARILRPNQSLERLVRMLQTVNGVDKVLQTYIFAQRLLVHFLQRAGPEHGETIKRIVSLVPAFNDARFILRLAGLGELPVIQGITRMENHPPQSTLSLFVRRAQLWLMFAYFPLEHYAWLAGKGAIKVDPALSSRASVLSVRCMALALGLGFYGLYEEHIALTAREKQLARQGAELDQKEKARQAAKLATDRASWAIRVVNNLCFFPIMSQMGGLVSPFLNDMHIGLLGSVASAAQLYAAWQATA
ncbi:hypothetical protein M427DRAFT_63211 [Gonapodya prolifera JEL478]|uniref:Peroxisomal biogenesis factor 11 n=1 Tax=Gonapodya prolifera (strain JEL478) TaxID=1344416 RepID=A0A138ZZP3_GONPJ|nr:hypothetical protein M427DRAFT_63211 [Gonapodya prolifera JEL478]|eukprot:KXS09976.1 hypothetical protein M427DRAFT_63211 [Gonapodya prolifera JEL478]